MRLHFFQGVIPSGQGLRPTQRSENRAFVTPAQAGVHVTKTNWIPAFAGMT
jgi:hypothetical protein